MFKRTALALAALIVACGRAGAVAESEIDSLKIDVYVTPYYNSAGPVVHVGRFSSGLASNDDRVFVSTIRQMKRQWNALRFYELYVGAIRLYDLGYRNEAVYWFYTAQYRGRLFATLADQDKLGSMGDPGFELYSAQDAFFQLAGPTINAYAFGRLDSLERTIRRVQSESHNVPDMRALYPGVAFKSEAQWKALNAQINSGLGTLATTLASQKDQIEAQRRQNGTQARFAGVTSKDLPR